MSDESTQPAEVQDERPYRAARRANLAQLVSEEGGVTKFALLIDTPKTHISAMLKGNRNVGDELASKIEHRLDKPIGWMDQLQSSEVGRSPIEPGDPTPVTVLMRYLESINPVLLPSARELLHKLIDGAIAPDDAFHDLDTLHAMTSSQDMASRGRSSLDLPGSDGTAPVTKFATR